MFKLFFGLIIITNLLFSCIAQQKEQKYLQVINSPAIDCSQEYSVRKGETLVHIARTCGISLPTLAKINQLYPPYSLFENQIIYFSEPQETNSQEINPHFTRPPKVTGSAIPNYLKPKKNTRSSIANLARPAKQVPDYLEWIMPVDLPIKWYFSQQHLGITFNSVPGKDVYAIANGTVVYSGNRMISHGKIIILKHKNNFYSSYAQNKELLVKDGQQVYIGDVIAITGKKPFKLEMREQAVPVDPLDYIQQ